MSEKWLPIKTAPRNGETILVAANRFGHIGYGDYQVRMARYSTFDQEWRVWPRTDGDCQVCSPDYWLPLPEVPERRES